MFLAMVFASLSRWYQVQPLKPTASTSATATLSIGEPLSPDSSTAAADAAARLPFAFGCPSRLIRIIGFQNSLTPTPPPPPTGRRFFRSALLPALPPEA